MAYLGQQPVVGRYILLDQISGGFNGTASGFTMSTAGGAQGVIPGLAQNVLLSLGGVIQQPGVDYSISGSGLTFTTPPVSGTTFFATVLGDAQSVGTPSDGTVTPASIASGYDFAFPNLNVTGVVTIASGSAASPSLTFTGDLNTGLYSPGADQIAVATNGTGRLFVDASGRVGIGTTPGRTLDVNGSIRTGGSANPFLALNDGSNESYLEVNSGNTRLTAGANDLTFFTGVNERMRITSAGLVGIGTSSFPSSGKLQVAGGSATTSIGGPGCISLLDGDANNEFNVLKFDTSVGGPIAAIGAKATTTGAYPSSVGELHFAVQNGASTNTALVIDSSGRVGIGTTSPVVSGLTIESASSTQGIELSTDTGFASGPTIRGYYRSGSSYRTLGITGSQVIFGIQDVEKARIDSSGRLGIGTSSPSGPLDVVTGSEGAFFRFSAASTNLQILPEAANGNVAIRMRANSGAAPNFQLRNDAGSNLVTITNGGSVGIGTTSPGALLDISASAPELRISSSNAGQTSGSSVGKLSFYTPDGTTPGGVGVAAFIETLSSTANGSDYQLLISKREGSGGGSNYINLGSSATGAISFGTNTSGSGTERMRIDSSGRLLVGTSSARSKFYAGNATFTPAFQVERAANTNERGTSFVYNSNNNECPIVILGKSRGTSVGSFTVVQNGDLIGRLSFQGADGTNLVEGATIDAFVDGAPGSNDLPTALRFSITADGASSPTERMRINKDGYAAYFGNGVRFGHTSGAGTAEAIIQGGHSASDIANMTTSFYVYTNGNVVNTNNSYGAISDAKLKENIVDANSQWDDLKALQVRNYNFKEGQTHTQIGLIAQEVELVSPGLVSESPDLDAEGNDLGTVTKSVNYSVLYMKAVKALQEAMERIEQLEQRLTDAGIA